MRKDQTRMTGASALQSTTVLVLSQEDRIFLLSHDCRPLQQPLLHAFPAAQVGDRQSGELMT